MVSYEFKLICERGGKDMATRSSVRRSRIIDVEPQPRACDMSPKARVPIVTLTVTLLKW
jgi:hypothetical protein